MIKLIFFFGLLSIGLCADCENTFSGTLSAAEYKELLDHHNDKRNSIALGKETGKLGSFPKAADMSYIYWDDKLAKLAQDWATELAKKCSGIGHNPNRKVDGFTSVGENVYGSFGGNADISGSLKKASESWYSEIDLAVPTVIKSFSSSVSGIGHFTQMIWAKSLKVGCGYANYSKGTTKVNQIVVCNYGEAGNYLGSKIYEEGEPCSKCPSTYKCSTSMTGLCVDPNAKNSSNILVVCSTFILLAISLFV